MGHSTTAQEEPHFLENCAQESMLTLPRFSLYRRPALSLFKFVEKMHPRRKRVRVASLLLLGCSAILFIAFSFHSGLHSIGQAVVSLASVASVHVPDQAKAIHVLQQAHAVCFDVDSTVVVVEGIDLLADCFGVFEEVANLTKHAMDGNVEFQDALAQRLEIMQPTIEGMQKCLRKKPQQFTKGIQSVVQRLKDRGVEIYLVSGGFKLMIEPVAKELGIPYDHIYANKIIFDRNGKYKDFDKTAPTSKSGGKPKVIEELKKIKGYKTVVMIGDGATDMEARPPADAFIGYGGVQSRPKVKSGADWFITNWHDLLRIL